MRFSEIIGRFARFQLLDRSRLPQPGPGAERRELGLPVQLPSTTLPDSIRAVTSGARAWAQQRLLRELLPAVAKLRAQRIASRGLLGPEVRDLLNGDWTKDPELREAVEREFGDWEEFLRWLAEQPELNLATASPEELERFIEERLLRG